MSTHSTRASGDALQGEGSSWPERLEPLTPLLLALHGVVLLSDTGGAPFDWALVLAAAVLGAAGVLGGRSRIWMVSRAWILLGIGLMLLHSGGGIGSFFALWLFMLSPVYSLVLGGRMAVGYPIVLGLAYLALAPASEGTLPPVVLWGRTAVLVVTGLLVAAISSARERAVGDAAHREEQRLKEVIASKDEFVASVSHELRTPLTAVVGLAAEMKAGAATLPAGEIEEFSDIIYHQAVEVANIVEDLLVAARADIGQVTVELDVVDVRKELEGVLAEHPAPHPTAVITIDGDGPPAIADAARVRQIIRNLLANAFRYGGNRIEGHVLVDDRMLVLEIADDGPGIPEGEVGRLFEPYRRFHRPAGQPSSIGLGLAVSRTLARLMNGELSYERREKWSVFRLELPTGGP